MGQFFVNYPAKHSIHINQKLHCKGEPYRSDEILRYKQKHRQTSCYFYTYEVCNFNLDVFRLTLTQTLIIWTLRTKMMMKVTADIVLCTLVVPLLKCLLVQEIVSTIGILKHYIFNLFCTGSIPSETKKVHKTSLLMLYRFNIKHKQLPQCHQHYCCAKNDHDKCPRAEKSKVKCAIVKVENGIKLVDLSINGATTVRGFVMLCCCNFVRSLHVSLFSFR